MTAATAAAQAAAVTAAAAAAATLATAETALAAETAGVAPTAAGAAGASSTDITSRLRIVIDANAESDAGVTFGAMVRIQQGEGQQGATNGARFYAKSGGLEVGVGNIWGAFESMPGQYPIDLGLTGLGYDYTVYGVGGADAYSSGGLGSSGANGIEVMYSMGDFTAHISASDTNDRIAAYGAYTFSGWTVALGLQDSSAATDTEITATVGGTVGPVSLGLAYAETGANVDRFVLSAGMDVGAATNVEAYYASQSDKSDDSYGIDFNHSLGGGTSLRGGVASNFSGQTVADFGVRFNF
nr:porin [Lentibacter algarum]